MPQGLYRSTAFAQTIQDLLRKRYFKEFPEQWGRLGRQYFKMQEPIFERMFTDYMGGAAGLGQAVPGAGLSSAAQEGLVEDLMGSFLAQSAGATLGAAQMPWQSAFGGLYTAPGAGGQMHAVKATQMGGAGFLGGAIGSGVGSYLGAAKGSGSGVLSKCCFIFVEVDNGLLNRIARRYRDEYGTPEQKIGYKRIASRLVPLMREYRIIKEIVKWTMVRPLVWWGKAFYGENRWGHIFWPVAKGWLKVFEMRGK